MEWLPYVFIAVAGMVSGVLSGISGGGGVGILALFVLRLLFGTTALEANATKRAVTAVLSPITFVAVLIGGFVVLSYGIIGFVSVLIETHLGSKIALRRGERFISLATASIIAVSGVALIAGALY